MRKLPCKHLCNKPSADPRRHSVPFSVSILMRRTSRPLRSLSFNSLNDNNSSISNSNSISKRNSRNDNPRAVSLARGEHPYSAKLQTRLSFKRLKI